MTIRPNPYVLSHAAAYRGRIESAAGVDITVQHIEDEWPDGVEDYWTALASRETYHRYAGGMTSRTAGAGVGHTEIAALDCLAKSLGVFDRLNPTTPTAVGERYSTTDMVAAE